MNETEKYARFRELCAENAVKRGAGTATTGRRRAINMRAGRDYLIAIHVYDWRWYTRDTDYDRGKLFFLLPPDLSSLGSRLPPGPFVPAELPGTISTTWNLFLECVPRYHTDIGLAIKLAADVGVGVRPKGFRSGSERPFKMIPDGWFAFVLSWGQETHQFSSLDYSGAICGSVLSLISEIQNGG